MKPKISVIIPAYNAHGTIFQTIQSVFDTNYGKIEIIVSDDCSNMPYEFPRSWGIILVRGKTNRGAGVARNLGLRKASGDWVLFLDADDIVYKNIFDVFYTDSDIREDIIACAGHKQDGLFVEGEVLPSNLEWIMHGRIYRRSFLLKNNIFSHPKVRIYEDSFFNMAAFWYAKKQNGILYMDEPCYRLVDNPNSVTRKMEGFFDRTQFERIEMITELVGQYYEIFPQECYEKLKFDRQYLPTEDGDDKIWFLLFDCVKRIRSIESYDAYCDFLKAEPMEREAALYRKWLDESADIRLSICIPLRNSHEYMPATMRVLQDVIGDKLPGIEIILTDDMSKEPDYEYVRGDSVEILYNLKIKRMGGNRNRALRMAKGKWVTFLDHDDELTSALIDEAFREHDPEIRIITGTSVNVDAPEQSSAGSYHCIEVCHGVLYRRDFLKKNDIWFREEITTSEDVYFNRRANICARMMYGESSVMKTGKIFYRWFWREKSAFCSTYNGRCYEEEFYREYAKAFLAAYDVDYIPKHVLAGNHLKLVYWASHQLKSFEQRSKNFKKANIKIFMGILLLMEDIWRLDKDNFMDWARYYDFDFERENPGEYILCQCFQSEMQSIMHYLNMAESLPEEWKIRLKENLIR